MEELRTCRESDDYAVIDIKTWTEQLKELRQMVESSSIIKIECDNNTRSAIGLIKISGSLQPLVSIVQEKLQMENNNRTPEQFTEIFFCQQMVSQDGVPITTGPVRASVV